MSEKTCKDCMNCSIEGDNEVYCSGMPWHYPFGGSDTVSLNKKACEYFLERDKPTVFDQITASLEVLAEAIVYEECEHSILDENGCGATFPGGWTSPIIEYSYGTKSEAIAATVEKLKEVAK